MCVQGSVRCQSLLVDPPCTLPLRGRLDSSATRRMQPRPHPPHAHTECKRCRRALQDWIHERLLSIPTRIESNRSRFQVLSRAFAPASSWDRQQSISIRLGIGRATRHRQAEGQVGGHTTHHRAFVAISAPRFKPGHRAKLPSQSTPLSSGLSEGHGGPCMRREGHAP